MIRKTFGFRAIFPSILFAFCFSGTLFSDEKTPELKKIELDWAEFNAPARMPVGKKFDITITVKQADPGTQLGGDVHLTKADGSYLTYGNWGGTPSKFEIGKPFTRSYTMPQPKDGSAGMFVHFYLTPAGKGWNERVKDGAGPIVFNDGVWVDPNAKPDTATLKKSWMKLGTLRKGENSSPGERWFEGDQLVMPVEYYVDPSDNWGETSINISAVGPWVDNPDGKYTEKRSHHQPRGLRGGRIPCEIGKVMRTEFKTILPKPFTAESPEAGKLGDNVLLICSFRGQDGKNWPWELRTGIGAFYRKDAFFELDAPTPGNLFSYDEAVRMQIVLGSRAIGTEKESADRKLRYAVYDVGDQKVAEGTVDFRPEKVGQVVPIPLAIERRGTFRISASVDGWETRETTFARIPNLEAIIGDKPTPFGGQKFAGNPEAVKTARMLGMSVCRVWVRWNMLQPARELWNEGEIAELGRQLDNLNENNVRPWLLLDAPPAWAIDNPRSYRTNFSPFPFKDEDLEKVVHRLATEFRDKISGFEWLNEIVPGKDTPNPVEDYTRFCRIATTTSKKIGPEFENQLAGGLWPRSFLKSLLAGGVAPWIDILPVHYSNGEGIEQARGDLAAVGEAERVAIWDNETGRGWSTWSMPLSEAMLDRSQGDWFMTQFPGQLIAGCKQIVVFGGEPDAAGNWSHFWSDMSPRPSAAPLAVLTSKLSTAKPLGEFPIGGSGRVCLFESAEGRPVMVVSSSKQESSKPESAALPVGEGDVFKTDAQGNEFPVGPKGRNNEIALLLSPSPYFVEGGDMDVLKAQLAVKIAAGGTIPVLTFVKDVPAAVPVLLRSEFAKPVSCTIRLRAGMKSEPITAELAPGKKKNAALTFRPEREGTFDATVEIGFDDPKLPALRRPIRINVVDASRIGNLLKNPGFETPGAKGNAVEHAAEHWAGSGTHAERVAHENPPEPGHGDFVCRFKNTAGAYKSVWQPVGDIAPGEYVYSMWIKADDLQTGSNITISRPDGKNETLSWMRVFHSPPKQAYWDVFRSKISVGEGGTGITASPVANGPGESFIDNLVLAPYEGTEYVGFAPRGKPKTIDGDLSDFDRSAPIPLIGKSQLHAEKDDRWTPENLSAAAWFNWDDQYLYVGVEVIDDKHVAVQKEENCVLDDSLELAFHPMNRQPGQDDKAFAYYVSAAHPGGGSGKHTIHRPVDKSGGLKSGTLARDSSVYDIAVRHEGVKTTYEIAIPFSDLGGISNVVGGKFGLSIVLNDNDGEGRKASMLWGEGLKPAWSPSAFGMLTLLGEQ